MIYSYLTLKDRKILSLKGENVVSLLQSLITQDLAFVDSGTSLFSLILDNKGRFRCDLFIIKQSQNSFLLDVSSDDVQEIIKTIEKYKLRLNIQCLVEKLQVYALILPRIALEVLSSGKYFLQSSNIKDNTVLVSDAIVYQDPRTPFMGFRIIASPGTNIPNLYKKMLLDKRMNTLIVQLIDLVYATFPITSCKELNIECLQDPILKTVVKNYTILRYSLAIPESKDLTKGKSIPLACNFEDINGISFNKGCYLGQEFTNSCKRVLNVTKKILCLYSANSIPVGLPQGSFIEEYKSKQKIGEVVSSFYNLSLVLTKPKDIRLNTLYFSSLDNSFDVYSGSPLCFLFQNATEVKQTRKELLKSV